MAALVCAGAETATLSNPGPLTIILVMSFNAVDLGTPGAPGPVWEVRLEFWDSDAFEARGDDDLLTRWQSRVPKSLMATATPNVPIVWRFMFGEQDEWNNEWGRDELYMLATLSTTSPGFAPATRVVGLIPRRW